MMRKTLLVLAIATASLLVPGLVEKPAEAGVHWSIGSAFSVGGLDFTVVFGRPFGSFVDGRYYRTHRNVHYAGYRCHNGCSFRDGYYYHHPNCSVVRHHFRRYSFYPEAHLTITPWNRGPGVYYDGYRYDSRRYDRYRYDRYRYDRNRYDRRDYRYRNDRHRYDRDRGRQDRSYRDRNERDHRRDGNYRPDDRRRRDGNDSGRRRGGDTRSRGRHDD